MNETLLSVLGGTVAFIGYTYAGYPAILWMANLRRGKAVVPVPDGPREWPFISVVIPAFNEEETIGRTLRLILEADYPADRRQILVVSDASTDRTDEIVRSFESSGVELIRMNTRGGKTRNENAVLPLLRGDIIVNTDAAMRIHPGAFKALVAALDDPSVGVASGRDASVASSEDDIAGGEGTYVGYEMWIRDLETALDSIVGASGCLYAMRAELHRRRISDDLSRDFASALTAREAGYRAVSVPGAICYVPRSASLQQEYRRKVRTIDRGLHTLLDKAHLLNPFRYGAFAWMLWSHKVCRWLVPFAALAAGLALGALAASAGWVEWVVAGVTFVGALASAGWNWPPEKPAPRWVTLPAFLVAGNISVIHAWFRAVTGTGTAVWEPTRRPAGPAAA